MSSILARMLACSKGLCETGGTVAGAVAGLYTLDNIMKDMGFYPIFIPFIKKTITNSSEAVEEPGAEADTNNKIFTEELKNYILDN